MRQSGRGAGAKRVAVFSNNFDHVNPFAFVDPLQRREMFSESVNMHAAQTKQQTKGGSLPASKASVRRQSDVSNRDAILAHHRAATPTGRRGDAPSKCPSSASPGRQGGALALLGSTARKASAVVGRERSERAPTVPNNARGRGGDRREPWRPASWLGKTTYRTAQTNNRVS